MRVAPIFALAATLAAAVAFADSAAPPPGAVARASDGGLVMSSQICATLAAADPSVSSAEYRPGVDVNGNAVAPADLPKAQPPAISADNFAIEIDGSLAQRINLPKQAGTGPGKTILGYVTLKDNQPYFNGAPLGTDQGAALAEACKAARR